MWSGPGPDPGGSAGADPPSSQELSDLKDQFEQQQLLIAQLKEMLRKSEQTTVTQEKVEEYANTLTKMKARAKRSVRKEGSKESISKQLETPASEKINLLRRQLEENRLKLAERGKSQRGIEEMVTQLKAQLDDSQILMNQSPNLSFAEVKPESYSADSTAQELYTILINKERRISEMTAKIQKLEANVLDLQENLKEKDSVIDARTKAITLMSENLSKKGKSTLDALDDTKLQMRKMQENFVELEMQMRDEKLRLTAEVSQKESEIISLKQRNVYLEEMQNNSNAKIEELQSKLENPDENRDVVVRSVNIDNLEKALEDSNKRREELESKLVELERTLEEKESTITDNVSIIKDLEGKITELEKRSSSGTEKRLSNLDIKLENEEVTKLKKQLDESNKNMIKVKAQHKGKIKELNKKIDSFRKMNDANAEVVKLNEEIAKLNVRITELEEENGTLQLKIVDSSTKDSTHVESVKQLEKKLSEQEALIAEKDENVGILTKRLEESSNEIEELNKKLSDLTHLQNVQVKSEINTIELEEQMDQLLMEKQVLIRERDAALEENASLVDKLETFNKEKQEILVKLESYVQENMELIDKLEKLSAEKVSSAESIEIVEGLTQQEKLELEAYQKDANIKIGSAEHLEDETTELNESVNQLTEETSELLKKIELFAVERREVMEKMEQLTQENNQLNLKIKEVENNRDVLAETYEQLQNEKERLDGDLERLRSENEVLTDKIRELESENEELKKGGSSNTSDTLQDVEEYKSLIEIQKQEIKELKVRIMGQDFVQNDKLELEAQLSSLQLQYESVVTENDKLKKDWTTHVCQREDLQEELVLARKRIEEFETKIAENLAEIENYKTTLEENKTQLISSANTIDELRNDVIALKNEVSHYDDEVLHLNSIVRDLNAAIALLEKENEENAVNAENSNQLEELKRALAQNIEEIEEYQKELENNSKIVTQLQSEIKDLNARILETEHSLETKNDELEQARKEKEEKDRVINQLHEEMRSKDEEFHRIINDFKGKYLNLQAQLETNTGSIDNIKQPLEAKIQELEQKNREQLEKMKIIAANLKKKTQALQNLERKYTEANEKWETEQKEKETLKEIAERNASLENELRLVQEKFTSAQNDLANQTVEYQKLKEELFDHKQRSNALENMNTKLSEEISHYIARFEDAQNIIREYEGRGYDRQISDLKEQLESLREASKANSDALQVKVQEMEMYIETQDADLVKYKERVSKLEEGLSYVEERRMSLERTAQKLGAELEEKTNECEEVSHTEDMLERRLTALISHDQVIEKRLREMTSDNEELVKQLKATAAENDALNQRLKEMKGLMNAAQSERETMAALENDVVALKKLVASLEGEKKNLRNEYEHKLRSLEEYNDKMEMELQKQLESFDEDRKSLAERNEKMADEIKEYLEQNEILSNELAEYKQKLDEQNKSLSDTNEACKKLQDELEKNVLTSNELEEIISKQEKTIFNLNEEMASNKNAQMERIKLLTEELHLKSLELDNCKTQSLQKETENQQNRFDFASSFFENEETQHLRKINEDLTAQINTLEKEKEAVQLSLIEAQKKLEGATQAITGKDEEPLKSEELKSLKAQYNNLEMNYGKLSEENIHLQNALVKLNEELEKSKRKQFESGDSSNLTTFTWPGEELFQKKVSTSEASPAEVDNTKEELLNKIRSLEFMLHDTEQQKQNALMQCNALSGELTKVLYMQEQQKNPLQSDVNLGCESEIISSEQTELTPTDLRRLRSLEFAPCKNTVDHQASSVPVVEEAIEPKTSYLCYDPEEAKSGAYTFGENDDGWGWGPEEAKLEQEHFDQISIAPQSAQFKGQIDILEEKIKVLEQARERHLEEIQQSQLKSGKLIKKLKEFKTKNEELASQLNKKSDGFDDLNDAIQEELKAQIQALEKRIREISADLEKERMEKGNLLKRVDTLTASHERMVENKEKQDVEISGWQQRCRELTAKLEQLEWGSDDSPKHAQKMETPSETHSVDARRIQELTDTIRDLTLDNEELQALLEEQRNLRLAAEKTKSLKPMAENMRSESEYLAVVNERNALQRSVDCANEESSKLKEEISNLSRIRGELQEKIDNLEEFHRKEIEQLTQEVSKLNLEKSKLVDDQTKNLGAIEELQKQLGNLRDNSDKEINDEAKKREETMQELNNVISSLNSQLHSLMIEYNGIQIKIEDFQRERENFLIQINQRDVTISELKTRIDDLQQQLVNLQERESEITQTTELLVKKEEELNNLKEKLTEKDRDYEFKLTQTLQQLNVEWAQKVDQRGFDVAESWKLHVEARENEFLEIERQLKKEISELEEKHTSLVNENNELRKNVDAEIRNEVDRVAALQQQINERQHYINDLTKVIQERQNEMERQKMEIENLNASVIELSQQLENKHKEIGDFKEVIRSKDDLLKELEGRNVNLQAEKENTIKKLKEVMDAQDSAIEKFSRVVEETKQTNESLEADLIEKLSIISDSSQKMEEAQQQSSNYYQQLQTQYAETEALRREVLKYHAIDEELSRKKSEMIALKALLEEKEREHHIALDTKTQETASNIQEHLMEIENLKRRLTETVDQYEDLLTTKDIDMQNLRLELEEQTKRNESFKKEKEDFLQVQTELGMKAAECEEMKTKIQHQDLLLEEESKQLAELREIIQDQVLKIDDLQKELYEKSSLYDALIAEIDITHKPQGAAPKAKKQVKFSDEVEVKNVSSSFHEDDLSEPVNRAELDLALYMLHQRDVRCEELTVELMQLLEERDTLQLKLSNALREKEILLSKYEAPNLSQSMTMDVSQSPVIEPQTGEKGSEEKPSSSDPLVSKISELKTLSYRKDKTIVDEQELRRLQQFSIMQQHRDEAAKLPPEAAARLVDANYTLSRDVQSPSKVLLNWLWGRSTPKVNNV